MFSTVFLGVVSLLLFVSLLVGLLVGDLDVAFSICWYVLSSRYEFSGKPFRRIMNHHM